MSERRVTGARRRRQNVLPPRPPREARTRAQIRVAQEVREAERAVPVRAPPPQNAIAPRPRTRRQLASLGLRVPAPQELPRAVRAPRARNNRQDQQAAEDFLHAQDNRRPPVEPIAPREYDPQEFARAIAQYLPVQALQPRSAFSRILPPNNRRVQPANVPPPAFPILPPGFVVRGSHIAQAGIPILQNRAFGSAHLTYDVYPGLQATNPRWIRTALNTVREVTEPLFTIGTSTSSNPVPTVWRNIRIRFSVALRFRRFVHGEDGGITEQIGDEIFLWTQRDYVIHSSADINTFKAQVYRELMGQIHVIELRQSQWQFFLYTMFRMQLNRFRLNGGCTFALPKVLAKSKSLINPDNEDNKCALYACLVHVFPKESNKSRVSQYFHELNNCEAELLREKKHTLDYPLSPYSRRWKNLEEMFNRPINIYGWEKGEKQAFVYRISSRPDCHLNPIDLCLVTHKNRDHYCAISNPSRFWCSGNKGKRKKQFCPRCVSVVNTGKSMQEHVSKECFRLNGTRIKFPPERNCKVSFKNFNARQPLPFVIFADYESVLDKETGLHIGCGYTLKIICRENPQYTRKSIVYRGEGASWKLLTELNKIQKEIVRLIYSKKYVTADRDVVIPQEEHAICDWCECHIKSSGFGQEIQVPVKIYSNLNGKQIRVAHKSCENFWFFRIFKIPVVFHNLSGYDSHLLLCDLDKCNNMPMKTKNKVTSHDLSAIHTNGEKIKTMWVGRLHFIDSYAFMKESLGELVNNLRNTPDARWEILKSEFTNKYNPDLLLSKGVYPYEYMDNFERFNETSLPPIGAFFSKLSNRGISEEDYQHAQNVWEYFDIKNLGEYHDLYMKLDGLLLAEVWEAFTKNCFDTDGLDPAYFVTLSSFSWSSLLRETGVVLDLFHQEQAGMHFTVEKGIRGGLSSVCGKKYSVHTPPTAEREGTFILYLDATNLYGLAMSMFLPVGNFNEMLQDEIPEFIARTLMNVRDDSETGYILVVDLDYPVELHDSHNDYPLAPERLSINGQEKLMLSLRDKRDYVCHYRTLQFYIKKGLVLKKVHKVISFTQRKWMEPYVAKRTELRRNTKVKFLQDFYKQEVNGNFGKTMENKRARIDFQLVMDENVFNKKVANPRFKNFIQYNEKLGGAEMHRKEILLDKPIIVGFTVLELSKLHMQTFWYDTLKRLYGAKVRLIYTDTDSFVLELTCMDLERELYTLRPWMDFSKYPKDSRLYKENLNNGVLGVFKDETNGHMIKEFVALRSKMYSYILVDPYIDHDVLITGALRAKGIPKSAVDIRTNMKIHHDTYLKMLRNELDSHSVSFYKIQSRRHQLRTIHQPKKGLASEDTKRVPLLAAIPELQEEYECLSYGHYLLGGTNLDNSVADHSYTPPEILEDISTTIEDLNMDDSGQSENEEEEEEEEAIRPNRKRSRFIDDEAQ